MNSSLPVHFFTLVLNGMPFLRYHAEMMRRLDFPWQWHVVEGVAAHRHDSAWPKRGRIVGELHRGGLSHDGTTEYLDALVREFPGQIHVYRKEAGGFWDGKREMVNAPLERIGEECLLWQVDSDELWTAAQVATARDLFLAHPEREMAYYYCHYFVGDGLAVLDRGGYGNYEEFEWRRTWRYRPGMKWKSHAPPILAYPEGEGWREIPRGAAFSHAETERAGLVFQHYAYSTPEQLRFKEFYYGYEGALAGWERLQRVRRFPVRLRDYFPWVREAELGKGSRRMRRWRRLFPFLVPGVRVGPFSGWGVAPLAVRQSDGAWRFDSKA